MSKLCAIFLDRDGTIIEDVGYISKINDVSFYKESFRALSLLQEHFVLFIITNQSGIAKEITTEKEVTEVNQFIIRTLASQNINIRDVFCCPHNSEDNCKCHKPQPYFIHQAAKLYDLDLENSYILGDHPSDIECGLNAGVTPYYLLTGHGEKHRLELNHDVEISPDIEIAANTIIKKHLNKIANERFL